MNPQLHCIQSLGYLGLPSEHVRPLISTRHFPSPFSERTLPDVPKSPNPTLPDCGQRSVTTGVTRSRRVRPDCDSNAAPFDAANLPVAQPVLDNRSETLGSVSAPGSTSDESGNNAGIGRTPPTEAMAPPSNASEATEMRDVRVRLNHYSSVLGDEKFYTIQLAADGSDSIATLKQKISVRAHCPSCMEPLT